MRQKRERATKIVGEKVTYKGQTYNYSQANQLSSDLKIFGTGQSHRNGKIAAFYGCSAPYSNFYPALFREGATTYTCSEQMYQQQLCLHFADAQAARAVLLQTDPAEMKRIGDRLLKSNLEECTRWYNNHARNMIKNAVRLQFQQHPALCELLKNHTGQFIEANRYDSIWGVGLTLDRKFLEREQIGWEKSLKKLRWNFKVKTVK